MRSILIVAALSLAAGFASTAPVLVESPYSVKTTVSNLTDAVGAAGAEIFTIVPHAAGAESVGEDLAPMQLVIFGNPNVGTAAM